MDWYNLITKNTSKIALASLIFIGMAALDYALPKNTHKEKIKEIEQIYKRGKYGAHYFYNIVTEEEKINCKYMKSEFEGMEVTYTKTLLLRTVTQFQISNQEGQVITEYTTPNAYLYGNFKLIVLAIITLASICTFVAKLSNNLSILGFIILICWIIYLFNTMYYKI